MTTYYYSLFIVFTVIAVMIIIDQNVSEYLLLILKIIKVNFQRLMWRIRFHPMWIDNPIGKWWMMRKYEKTIRELAQELSKKQSDAVE
jgi:hypothetical protein